MSFEEVYIEFVREKMKLLSNFPKISNIIYRAIKEVLNEYKIAGEIYFFGSVIDGNFTASSDIDVAIVVDKVPSQRIEIEDKVMRILEANGLPFWFPLEFHFLTHNWFEVLKRGGANFIKAEEYVSKYISS